ncbi:hypothetical protein L9F63_006484, partial [Diploptera punctata]
LCTRCIFLSWTSAITFCSLAQWNESIGYDWPMWNFASRSARSLSGSPSRAGSPARHLHKLSIGINAQLSKSSKYRVDELHCMTDEELKDLGLPSGAITQLRSIVTKINSTNGLCSVDKRESGPSSGRRKIDTKAEIEQASERKTQSAGPVMRRFPSMPLDSAGPMIFQPPPPQLLTAPQGTPCYTCIAVPVSSSAAPARFHHTQQFACLNHHMRSLHLDGDASRHCSNSSSASDSSSTSHSPPDTPSIPNAPHWDNRGNTSQESGGGESASNTTSSRPRLPGGVGRSKANPPGLQTLPRGRGPNTSTRSSHPPPQAPPHEERKLYLMPTEMVQLSPHTNVTYTTVNSTSQPPSAQYSGTNSGNNPPPRPGDMSGGSSNVPYTPATAYLQHAHFPTLRTTGTLFPSFPPGSYIRPTYPFPNGEIVYQYHGPQTPPPPPPTQFMPTPVVTYSTVVPPPKVSCYNCGSHSHFATDCKENTMEEMTKQGQYNLDYSPYQKTGECSTEK